MNRREMKFIQKQKRPVRGILRKFATIAAGLVLVSPLVFGCAAQSKKVQIASSATKPAVVTAEVKQKKVDTRPIEENPFPEKLTPSREGMPTPVPDENPF